LTPDALFSSIKNSLDPASSVKLGDVAQGGTKLADSASAN
jgi:hypothetical protein